MVPFDPPTTDAERRFNRAHAKIRVVIETTHARLKNSFRCVKKDRVLHYHPDKAGMIVNCCAILHNLHVEEGSREPEEVEEAIVSLIPTGEATALREI